MLNLITIAFNYDFLANLYNSIPKEEDIRWWIVGNNEEEISKFKDDSRVIIISTSYSKDFSNFGNKINIALEFIEGHFQIIDEDTLYHSNSYKIYQELKYFTGLIIGEQYWYNNIIRLKATLPQENYIDTGSCICHKTALGDVKWDSSLTAPDYHFWNKIWENSEWDFRTVHEPISYYNAQLNQTEDKYK